MNVLDEYECIFDTYTISNDISVLNHVSVNTEYAGTLPRRPAERPLIKMVYVRCLSSSSIAKNIDKATSYFIPYVAARS